MIIEALRNKICDDLKYKEVDIEVDQLSHIISNSRRRQVIKIVSSEPTGESMYLEEIAEMMCKQKHNMEEVNRANKEYKRIYISLYQTHCPKLHNSEVVKWDSEDSRMIKTDNTEPVAQLIGVMEEMCSGGEHASIPIEAKY